METKSTRVALLLYDGIDNGFLLMAINALKEKKLEPEPVLITTIVTNGKVTYDVKSI